MVRRRRIIHLIESNQLPIDGFDFGALERSVCPALRATVVFPVINEMTGAAFHERFPRLFLAVVSAVALTIVQILG